MNRSRPAKPVKCVQEKEEEGEGEEETRGGELCERGNGCSPWCLSLTGSSFSEASHGSSLSS